MSESDAPLIAVVSMSNPCSLGWGLEMWAYAFLGVATWLVAPVLAQTGLERGAARRDCCAPTHRSASRPRC